MCGTVCKLETLNGMDLQKQKTAVALLSVISNSILVVGKLLIGLAIGSVSVISEGLHSGMDLAAAVIALTREIAVQYAAKDIRANAILPG
jgi:divalent metal cation (Fe/Co/Zn/Cd) transporter